MADTLLAYLISRVVTQREPAATQALAYILNSAPDIAKAFVSVVHQTGFAPFELGRIAAEEQHGGQHPRPDDPGYRRRSPDSCREQVLGWPH